MMLQTTLMLDETECTHLVYHKRVKYTIMFRSDNRIQRFLFVLVMFLCLCSGLLNIIKTTNDNSTAKWLLIMETNTTSPLLGNKEH